MYEGDTPFLAASFVWVIPVYVVLVTSDESSRRAKDAMIVCVVFTEVANVRPLTERSPWVRFAKVKRTDGIRCRIRDCNKKLSLMSPARD